MNRGTITFLFCFLFCLASLFGCTSEQKKESMSLKSGNDVELGLSKAQHRQQAQSLSNQFPGVVIYKGNPKQKRVALTFDDGPDRYYTPRILDILRAKGVPGTFFMLGKKVKLYPDMARRIVSEGHAIGNHSWDHPKLYTLSNEKMTKEIVSTAHQIQRITGKQSNLFRPPYGKVSAEDVILIHELGYRIIDWSVDTFDFKGTSAPAILQHVMKDISPGGIILQHCAAVRSGELDGTLKALPQIIDQLRAKGYEFVTIPTLLSN